MKKVLSYTVAVLFIVIVTLLYLLELTNVCVYIIAILKGFFNPEASLQACTFAVVAAYVSEKMFNNMSKEIRELMQKLLKKGFLK